VAPGDLYGVFDRLRSRCQKYGLFWRIARCELAQALGKLDVDIVGRHLETGVTESIELIFDRSDNLGMIVAGITDSNASGQIYVSPAFNIPDFCV
jgi:hypothetical protein